MAFRRIFKTRMMVKDKVVGAVLRTSTDKTAGRLYFTKEGMRFLEVNDIALKRGDKMDVFFDDETKEIAINRTDNGMFAITLDTENYKRNIQISSKDLEAAVGKTTHYRLATSTCYDLLLIPID